MHSVFACLQLNSQLFALVVFRVQLLSQNVSLSLHLEKNLLLFHSHFPYARLKAKIFLQLVLESLVCLVQVCYARLVLHYLIDVLLVGLRAAFFLPFGKFDQLLLTLVQLLLQRLVFLAKEVDVLEELHEALLVFPLLFLQLMDNLELVLGIFLQLLDLELQVANGLLLLLHQGLEIKGDFLVIRISGLVLLPRVLARRSLGANFFDEHYKNNSHYSPKKQASESQVN